MKKRFQYLKEIIYLLGSDRKKVPGLIFIFILSSLLDVIGIGMIGPYIALVIDIDSIPDVVVNLLDVVGVSSDRENLLWFLSLSIFIVFFVKTIISILVNKTIISFSENQQVRLRSSLMHSFQCLPYIDFLRRNSAEYIYSIQQLTGKYSGQVVLPVLKTISEGIVSIVIIMFLAWQNLQALIIFVTLIGSMVIAYDLIFKHKIKEYGEKINQSAKQTIQSINEGIYGLKEIRVLGKEKYFFELVETNAIKQALFGTRMLILTAIPKYILELLMISFVVIIVIIVALIGNESENVIPTLSVFGVAALRLAPSANTFSSSLLQIRYNRDSVNRLYNDLIKLNKVGTNKIHHNSATKRSEFISLSLENVDFIYPNTELKTLSDISLDIFSGECIGFIGPSGAGKTTLVDLLLGLLIPQKGNIKLNGKDINISSSEWRSQIAYLPQEVFLIDDTLRNNVALGVNSEEIDDSLLFESLRKSRLIDLVSQLPDGVNTILGERGARISGGQRQRVALARAFYHSRDILVMDEATSALDNETEKEIVEEIYQLKSKKTIIVIAHRITTLKNCDRIYELNQGKIVKVSKYEEIIKTG